MPEGAFAILKIRRVHLKPQSPKLLYTVILKHDGVLRSTHPAGKHSGQREDNSDAALRGCRPSATQPCTPAFVWGWGRCVELKGALALWLGGAPSRS